MNVANTQFTATVNSRARRAAYRDPGCASTRSRITIAQIAGPDAPAEGQFRGRGQRPEHDRPVLNGGADHVVTLGR